MALDKPTTRAKNPRILTELGKELRKLRIDKGFRLTEFAELLGMYPSHVSSVESGRRSMPKDFVNRVVEVLGLAEEERWRLQSAAEKAHPLLEKKRWSV